MSVKEENPTEEKYYQVYRNNGLTPAVHFYYKNENKWSSETDCWLEEVRLPAEVKHMTDDQIRDASKQYLLMVTEGKNEDQIKFDFSEGMKAYRYFIQSQYTNREGVKKQEKCLHKELREIQYTHECKDCGQLFID